VPQLLGKWAALQEKTAPLVEQNRALTAQLEQLARPAPETGTDQAAAVAAAQARIAQLEQQLYAVRHPRRTRAGRPHQRALPFAPPLRGLPRVQGVRAGGV